MLKALDGKMIQCLNDEHTYRRFDKTRLTFDTLAHTGRGWGHKDNPQYWEMVDHPGNTFGKKVSHLKSVCWFDPFVEATGVPSEG